MSRILSAIVLIGVIVATIWLLPVWAMAVFAAITAALAGTELAHMAARVEARVPAWFLALASAAVTLALAMTVLDGPIAGTGSDVLGGVLMVLLVVGGSVALRLGPPAPPTFTSAAVLLMAPVYIGLPLGAVVWTHGTLGPAATTWLLGTIALSDSAQYYCGRLLGRTKLAPAVSPAKTMEGALGGLAVAAGAGVVFGPMSMPGLSPVVAAVVAAALAISGMAGDLFESLLKRSAGVKDSSALIPGHGGVLDRIDSYLFAAPVFYLFLRFVR